MTPALKVMKVMLLLVPVLVKGLPLGSSDELESVGDDKEAALYLSSGVNRLSADLFKILSSGNESNVVISPFSIHTAMSMLYRGSQGDTRSQLGAALGVENADHEKLLEENKRLLNNYVNMSKNVSVELEVANSLFADDSFEIKEDYQRLLEEFYLTKVETVDFGDESETVDTINEWVRNKTRNLIQSLVESVSSDTRMLLLNAVYFKANWQVPFEKVLTSKRSFHASPTKSVETDFMLSDEMMEFASLGNLNADVVSLPYEDENFRMLIFLPHEGYNVEDLETDDFPSILDNIDDYLFRTDLLLRLPKFKIDYSKSLVESFQQLGVSDAFVDADLSQISDEPLFVSDIVHKVAVEVTEEGSEAAAVTGIFIQARSGGIEAVMDINRPFKFVIQDKRNNIPLFVGKISDPTNGKVNDKLDAEESKVDMDEDYAKEVNDDYDEDMTEEINDDMEKENMNDTNGKVNDDLDAKESKVDMDEDDEKEVYDDSNEDMTEEINDDMDEMMGTNSDVEEDDTTEINEDVVKEEDNEIDVGNEDYMLVLRNNDVSNDLHHDSHFFPLNNKDTDPILNYIAKFGDGSIYGNLGELANIDNAIDQYDEEDDIEGLSLSQKNGLEDNDIFDLRGIDIFENNSIEEDSSEELIDIFPENNQDTEPIMYYKTKFGDGSVYGHTGELAIQVRNT